MNQVGEKGFSLLLYKDARCDQTILDETVGVGNWQRRHYECKGNLFCSVGINLNYKHIPSDAAWVWKDDCGTESNTEKEKGEASDSFKRACFNWGIGRELYTKIFIFINGGTKPDTDKDDKPIFKNGKKVYVLTDKYAKYHVKEIETDNTTKKIKFIQVADDKGVVKFTGGDKSTDQIAPSDLVNDNHVKAIREKLSETGRDETKMLEWASKKFKRDISDIYDLKVAEFAGVMVAIKKEKSE